MKKFSRFAFFILIFFSPFIADADITTGLVGHWKFDEGSGTTATDWSGNNYTGTLTNGPTYTTGQLNGGLNFDGVDDFVAAPEDSLVGATTLTISAWINPRTRSDFDGIVASRGTETLVLSLGGASNGNDDVQLWTDLGSHCSSSGNLITNNTWHHVVVTYDAISGACRMYHNGSDRTVVSTRTHTSFDLSDDFRIGMDKTAGRVFDGLIDDVRIYNRVLSSADVAELYNYTEVVSPTPTPPPPAPTPTPTPNPTPTPTPTPTSPVGSSTYYVRTDGHNTNCNGTVNAGATSAPNCAWLTINKAATTATVVDGNTVRVQAGTYSESVSPTINGSLNNPITFVADGAVIFCTLNIGTGDDYLRFIGFTIDTDAGSCVKAQRAVLISNGSITNGVEFWNNTIRDATHGGATTGSTATRGNNWVMVGNVIENIGNPADAVAISLQGDHNIFAYNEFRNNVDDQFAISGSRYSYYLNNYTHNITQIGGHPDIFQSGSHDYGLLQNVFKSTMVIGNPASSDEHVSQHSNGQGATKCTGGIPGCGPMSENLW